LVVAEEEEVTVMGLEVFLQPLVEAVVVQLDDLHRREQ
jgi:hypothetical protein